MQSLLHQILLDHHVVPLEAAALALAGDRADPLEGQVRRVGELARVLDVIPDSVGDAPELPLDRLAVVDGVEITAPLQPPEAATGVVKLDVAPARVTAPPSSASSAEHKVKPSKKTPATAPAISKRITSTAANASVTLPAMEMNATGSDVMASVMSSMGASSLGAGGSAGMAAMPLTGMTVFGFKGTPKTKGLVGKFYDFKQFKDRKDNMTFALRDDIKCVIDFLSGSHDPNLFEKYFCPFTKLFTGRVYIPTIAVPIDALKAFDVEKEVKTPGQWIIHYSGTVVAPRSGEYRFRGAGDNLMAVSIRQGGENAPAKNVLLQSAGGYMGDVRWDPLLKGANSENKYGLAIGNWFTVKENEEIAIDVLIGEIAGTSFNAYLLIEEKGRTYMPKGAYPVFEVIKDLPPSRSKKTLFQFHRNKFSSRSSDRHYGRRPANC